MRNLALTMYLLFVSLIVNATHLICGDIVYNRIQTFSDKSVQFEIKLLLIRDAIQTDVNFDQVVRLGIYDKLTKDLVDSVVISNPTRYSYNKLLCVNDSSTNSFEVGEYTILKTLKRNLNGYSITWERCCKGEFTNVEDENNRPHQPFYLIAEIPNTDIVNSSPSLPYLLQGFCKSTENRWSLSLFDQDGDSLAIALSPLYVGRAAPIGSWAVPPINSTLTPKSNLKYRSSYSYISPFGSTVSIDLAKNQIRFNTPQEGSYNVGLLVKEFRKGALISAHTIDMAALVFSCQKQGQDKPAAFFLEKFGPMQPLLTWNTCNTPVAYFQVLRSENLSTNFKLLDTVSALTNRYIDSSLTTSGRYFYKIKGIPKAGQTSGETEVRSIDLFKVGVDNALLTDFLKIYPNPFQEVINIESEVVIEEIFVFNAVGQLVHHVSPNDRKVSCHISLEKGLYIIDIRTVNRRISRTIMQFE